MHYAAAILAYSTVMLMTQTGHRPARSQVRLQT